MMKQKSAAAIHDISGLGKCSLTAAIPVLSAAGVSVAALPTAFLSTQTGGLNEYTYRDLTPDMRPAMAHWKKIGVRFDAIYSGFLGSAEQVDIVREFVSTFRHEHTLFLCDPAMADNGRLYDTFDDSFVDCMKNLCADADILVPNFTEAALLLGEDYHEPPYTTQYVERIASALSACYGVRDVVLTGVAFDEISLGAAAYSAETKRITYSLRQKVRGMFHSTGDLFASALLGGLLNGYSLNESAEKAIDFVVASIRRTVDLGGDSRFGLAFELCLPQYMRSLGLV